MTTNNDKKNKQWNKEAINRKPKLILKSFGLTLADDLTN
jgi:hypothetical protein